MYSPFYRHCKVERPSVCPVRRFAAERRAGRRYRSTEAGAGAQQQRRRRRAFSSKCGQCRVESEERGWTQTCYPRYAVLAVLAMALSVCVSLSQVGVPSFLAWRLPWTYPILRLKEIQVSTKIRVLFSRIYSKLWTWNKFRHSTSIVATYCQVSSTKVDAERDKLDLIRFGDLLSS